MQIEQCGLSERVRVEFVATRVPESPVLEYTPTGKVPMLVLEDGTAIGEVRLICEYLDDLHDGPAFAPLTRTVEERALEGMAVGFNDGAAVWVREARRPSNEQAPGIVQQERARAQRCMIYLDTLALRPATDFTMCSILMPIWRLDYALPDFEWQSQLGRLAAWYETQVALPSFVDTLPE
ncbi:MAG: hypothetical protein HOI95_22835 [Chromatiales bacterium]|jgi:glutathione S-transferase|nr:hypothetical protein [Chromatiales bacterium]